MPDVLVTTRPERYAEPPGDPGWFGPDSVAWRVHSDLGAMLVGGFAALLLQTLHPLVMQGVADHSNYREDPFGRLQRTAEFIAATTYGGDALASSHIRHVQAIHDRVKGSTADGARYSANDPELLRYVHVTECFSFLASHQRYSGRPLLKAEKDRYLAEMAQIAERLGAGRVPTTTAEVRRYLRAMRPQLRRTPEASAAARFLLDPPEGAGWFERLTHTTICEACIDLLPGWARSELRLWRPASLRLSVVRPSAGALTAALRFGGGGSPVLEAARSRVDAGKRGAAAPAGSRGVPA